MFFCKSLPTLWPSWAQLLTKNFRAASLSAHLSAMSDWMLAASLPQMALLSAGLS
jgi:hypothetical protein